MAVLRNAESAIRIHPLQLLDYVTDANTAENTPERFIEPCNPVEAKI